MRDLVLLDRPQTARDYVQSLWRTEAFRDSAYVQTWVDRFAQHPSVFATMSDAELETPHFGTFFGMTYARHYDEPAVSDLYYLHEIVHAALLSFDPEQLFTAWYRKMNGIEFAASLETEGYVYMRIPGLREQSFKDEIWADRYIGAQRRLGEGIFDIMRQDRYKAMQQPDPMDWCEQQIAGYARQNFEWAAMWRLDCELDGLRQPAYRHVEAHMAALRRGERSPADHLRWLTAQGEVPFVDQARLFAPVYWNNKLSYRLRKLG
ncbi:MAG: hypothetical protein U0168_00895 [Nannocystaceae bacterium]